MDTKIELARSMRKKGINDIEQFLQVVLYTAPRIMGFIDREVNSATYGCSDRYFWHYKLHDFTNVRFQESCLILALLYRFNFPENLYRRKRSVFNLALAVAEYWAKNQNKDGSVSEVYPHERSFCATSFSTLAVCETLMVLLDDENSDKVRQFIKNTGILVSLQSAAEFLKRSIDFTVSNQAAAAATAIHCVGVISGTKALQIQAAEVVGYLIGSWRQHGHFPEYDGFDLGYSTITASLLTTYIAMGGGQEIGQKGLTNDIDHALADVADIARELTDSHGNYDCDSMSRNTSYLFPNGLVRCGRDLLGRLQTGLAANKVLSPLWMDDRFCIGLGIDYLKAYLFLAEQRSTDVLEAK